MTILEDNKGGGTIKTRKHREKDQRTIHVDPTNSRRKKLHVQITTFENKTMTKTTLNIKNNTTQKQKFVKI